jgi:hypothetical protein
LLIAQRSVSASLPDQSENQRHLFDFCAGHITVEDKETLPLSKHTKGSTACKMGNPPWRRAQKKDLA